jgi:hypothetical protein
VSCGPSELLRLSVAIQYHPSRAEIIDALVNAIEPDPVLRAFVDVVPDPEPNGVRNPWRTYRAALERTPADATHRLVVQDDVLVCPGFQQAVKAAIRARPDRALAFFVGGQSREHAQAVWDAGARGDSWATLGSHTWVPVVALCLPSRIALPLVAWADRMFEREWPQAFRADDEIVGHYLREHGEYVLASVPCLVEHPDVIPSIIHGRGFGGNLPDRKAVCWIGDCDAATIDWTLGPA